jgi:murein DD-endopeptidase MepM/ murein hydrolase activator NlpD
MTKSVRWILMIACGVAGAAVALLGTSTSITATVPRLLCPVRTCSVGGYRFGDDWTVPNTKCPPKGPWKKHTGADIHAAAGTEVVAAEAGTVKLVYSAGAGWANAILIEHASGNSKYVTQYMHVDAKPGIGPGTPVKRGTPIANVAAISLPHLHFGVWNGPYGPSAGQRGALPSCTPPATSCNDGTRTDPCFPQLWVNPMTFF